MHQSQSPLYSWSLKTAKCQPSEMVYVGDDPALDVEAARSLGIFTVWVQSPDAKKPEIEPNYHATIHDLDDLPTIERSSNTKYKHPQ